MTRLQADQRYAVRVTVIFSIAWLLAYASFPLTAEGATGPAVRLHATFVPERLGRDTTVEFSAQIATPTGDRVPPPLTELSVSYPQNLGIGVGELGLVTCTLRKLEADGPQGCPANSRMGEGSALAEIPIGSTVIYESASVEIIRAPEEKHRLSVLFFATGEDPVFAEIPFFGELLPAPPPYGGQLHIKVPLVESLPEAPYVSVTRLHATVGPLGLTYYEYVHGKKIAYKPRGILLPKRCPRDGFPFRATLAFLNGSSTTSYAHVPCPQQARSRGR